MKRLLWLLGIILLIIVGRFAYQAVLDRKHEVSQTSNLKKKDISVTITEGKRREEIAWQLDTAGITTYDAFMSVTAGREGTIFPDTYRFFPDTPAADVYAKITKNYQTKVGDQSPTEEQLILASIIEREAANDSERADIAGVYENRIEKGMKLEADPTVQYGKDTVSYWKNPTKDFKFWGEITRADYQAVQSSYNTYIATSLPPAPICNPGLKSIQAAMNPTKHSYYYFVHRNGQLLLSKTLAEHQSKL